MTLEHKISDEFRARLEKLSETDKTLAIVRGVVNTEGLSELPREERRREARKRYQEAIEPIQRYCEEQGINDLRKLEALGIVICGSLTRAQVYDLAEQPYVQGILENQKVALIR